MLAFYKKSLSAVFLFILSLSLLPGASAQSGGSSTSVTGTVTDPTGAVVANATVEIRNPVSGFSRTATTDSGGKFTIPNVPFNPYHVAVSGQGFSPHADDVDVRSVVPVNLSIVLQVKGSSETVTVEGAGEDLLENTSTFHTDVDRGLFDKMPLESRSSSVSSLVTLSSPGIAADSNGLFHGLGDHAENSFSVDGQPITDQQSKVFSNQIPLDSIESMEVISGAPPAEFGEKTSVVINVTTRSGQGMTTPKGSVTASYGSFGSADLGINFGYGGQKWGNFISASGLNSGRFLDPPEFAVISRQGERRKPLRPGRLSTFTSRFGSRESGIHAFLVSDSERIRQPERHRRERQSRRINRPAFADQDLQHRAVVDTSPQPQRGFYAGWFCAARSVPLLSQRQSFCRPRPHSARDSSSTQDADQCRPALRSLVCEGHPQRKGRSHLPANPVGREHALWNRRSIAQRPLPGCERRPGCRVQRSFELRRSESAKCCLPIRMQPHRSSHSWDATT